MPTEPTPRDAVAGELYVVRSNAPIKITQTNDLGTLVMLDITEENGTNGNEVCFTAINGTDKMHITAAEGAVYAVTRGRGFNHGGAAASGTAGGTTVDITFDTTPTEGSTNAVTSGGTFALSLHPSVGKGSLASGAGAVAYCADSLAIGEGAVVGATYAQKNKTATPTRQSSTSESETNTTSWQYSHNSVAIGFHAQASGRECVAYGNYATAGAEGSSATGYRCTASGSYATASGSYATASGYSATASGYSATASGDCATASGYSATASGDCATANGTKAIASGQLSQMFGSHGRNSNDGVLALAAVQSEGVDDCGGLSNPQITQLYLIAAGSPLSQQYCNGEAGLGFITTAVGVSEWDDSWNIIASGTRKLSDLLTDNRNTFNPKTTREA